ncbi:MAG: CheR family methyltransferase [Gemmatimonadaceae bacterium]
MHLPIDDFLRSLAAAKGNSAIGVILSGTASDGALGLEAIKAEGGITFAQDERSARHTGMPRNAVGTGCVDFVLPPRLIAAELARIARHPHVRVSSSGPVDAPDETLRSILAIVRRASGVDFTQYKQATLRRRVIRRMVLLKLERLEDYSDHLREHPAEAEDLFHDLLISVTGFFRDPEVFETLQRSVFPRILKNKPADAAIRIWVPGCSTGEEVYSIGICLLEYLGDAASDTPIQLFGTDVSEKSIGRARTGTYSEHSVAGISAERLTRFFNKADGGYRISKFVRDLCVFARQDVTSDPPFSQMDLISCRNLLIYLGPELHRKVMPIFHYALKPAGVLLLGTAESVGITQHLFLPIDKKHKMFGKQRLPADDTAQVDFVYRPPLDRKKVVRTKGRDNLAVDAQAQVHADRIVLAAHSPPGVVINDQMEIVQFRGRTTPFLEPAPGAASFNLLRMVPKDLFLVLRSAIQTARRTAAPVRLERLTASPNRTAIRLNLEVIPFRVGPSKQRFFVILFEEVPGAGASSDQESVKGAISAGGRASRSSARDIQRLREELATTKKFLQSIIEEQEGTNEELRSATEEIQSSNEELQSTNEELETAKEELQSSNEELTTVNDELQHRIDELTQVSNDIQNVFASVKLPIVLLDNRFRIRRFTEAAAKMLNLIQPDVGRPMPDIQPTVDIDDWGPIVSETLTSLTPQEQEVRDRSGRWYSMRVRPYRTADNRIDGAVITFLDIDELKRASIQLDESRRFAQGIVETVREPLLVLDSKLRVVSANIAFYRTFQVSPEETESRPFYDIGARQWDSSVLRSLLEEILPSNTELVDFEVTHQFPKIGERTMLLNARRVLSENHDEPLILIAMEDVTERQRDFREALAARADAETANRTKSDFLAVMSHELRTPLNAIAGYAELLEMEVHGPVTDRQKQDLHRIVRNQNHLLTLIDGLLTFAKVEAGKLVVQPTEIVLQDLLGEVHATIEPLAREKHLEFDFHGCDPDIRVWADPDKVRQILLNLLSNALKFTRAGDRISLDCDAGLETIALHVRDTGLGIPTEKLGTIFEPFVQLDTKLTRVAGGVGLGLAISRDLARLMGGDLHVVSSVGKGATFTLTLPRGSPN